ncbi:MAG: hypothetical protein ACP5D1_07870 [Bacteroidales bacterium]
MHTIEPHFAWRKYYIASEDALSPFYGREYSEFGFTHAVYDHLIHPQWDAFGSDTLYLKILYVNYEVGCAILELIGEWNDTLYNDIMYLKRDVIEVLMENGVDKFILIGENVMNFHYSDDSYYEEWMDELEEGWIVAMGFLDHVAREFRHCGLDRFLQMDPHFDSLPWRTLPPLVLYRLVDELVMRRLGEGR